MTAAGPLCSERGEVNIALALPLKRAVGDVMNIY